MPFKWHLNRYKCFYCDTTFPDSSKLKLHYKEHKDIKIINILRRIGCYSRMKWDVSEVACKLCPKSLQNFDQYLDHIKYAHDLEFNRDVFEKYCYVFSLSDSYMSCTECGDSYKYFTPLLRHVNKYHNKQQQFICDYCGLGFALKGTIKSHIRNVHPVVPTTCKFCPETFKTYHALKNHHEAIHKKGKFKCHLCPEVLGSFYLKKSHLALYHNVRKCQYACNRCPRIFMQNSSLFKHISSVHLKEKSATCHVCGFKGFDMRALRKHMDIHDDSKAFKCEFCDQIFRRKPSLNAHKKKHHKDLLPVDDSIVFKCEICDKIFRKKRNLNVHIKRHNKDVKENPVMPPPVPPHLMPWIIKGD